jgi:hypothetical protein
MTEINIKELQQYFTHVVNKYIEKGMKIENLGWGMYCLGVSDGILEVIEKIKEGEFDEHQ